MDAEKAIKCCKQYAIAYIVIFVIMIVLNIANQSPALVFVGQIVAILLLSGLYMGAKNGQMYGPICGIIVSTLLFISMDIISILLGIFLISNCIGLIKALK